MAYDANLAARISRILPAADGFAARQMFGGVGYLLNGNMCVGILGDELIVRVGPAAYDAALGQAEVRKFDLTGRPMRGWVVVSARGVASELDLRRWLGKAVDFAESLPSKSSPLQKPATAKAQPRRPSKTKPAASAKRPAKKDGKRGGL